MGQSKPEFNTRVILSVISAFAWGIPNSLRALTLDWTEDFIYFYFFFNSKASTDDQDEATCIVAEVTANFCDIKEEDYEFFFIEKPYPLPHIDILRATWQGWSVSTHRGYFPGSPRELRRLVLSCAIVHVDLPVHQAYPRHSGKRETTKECNLPLVRRGHAPRRCMHTRLYCLLAEDVL